MIRVKVNDLILNLPEHLREIPLDKYCDFLEVFSNYTAFLQGFGENTEEIITLENQRKYSYFIAQMVGAITGQKDNVFSCQLGDFETHFLQMFAKEKGQIDYENTIDSLYSLFYHFYKIIVNFQPKAEDKRGRYEYNIGEEKYFIPVFYADALTLGKTPPNIQAARVTKLLDAQIEINKMEGTVADKYYTNFITAAICLSHKENEPKLKSYSEFEYYVETQKEKFLHLTTDVALNIDFFLNSSLHLLKKTLNVNIFGIPQSYQD